MKGATYTPRKKNEYQFIVIKTFDGTGEYKSHNHDIEAWLMLPRATRVPPRLKSYDDYNSLENVYKTKTAFVKARIKELGFELRKLDYKEAWKYTDAGLIKRAILSGSMVLVKKFIGAASTFVYIEDKYQKLYEGD
jgi:hypothetical protein